MKAYEIITNRIINTLKNNKKLWEKHYTIGQFNNKNYVSKKEYKGINQLMLFIETTSNEFNSNYWLTEKQCKKSNGEILKNQTPTPVLFWSTFEVSHEKQEKKKKIMYSRCYNVYNLNQTTLEPIKETPEILNAKEIIKNMPNKPKIKNDSAPYYCVTEDYIGIPHANNYDHINYYYQTLFHELSHSTGHSSRLNRKSLNFKEKGDEIYSKEELIAEISSCFIMSRCNIKTCFQNSISYIKNWHEALENNPSILIYVASQAQKAANYILNKEN